jgi:hypothetical protein
LRRVVGKEINDGPGTCINHGRFRAAQQIRFARPVGIAGQEIHQHRIVALCGAQPVPRDDIHSDLPIARSHVCRNVPIAIAHSIHSPSQGAGALCIGRQTEAKSQYKAQDKA